MHRKLKYILIIFAAIFSGCTGKDDYKGAIKEYEENKYRLLGKGVISRSNDDKITIEKLKEKWGEPNEKLFIENKEYWKYEKIVKRKEGSIITFLIPIQFMVLSDYNYVLLEIDDNKLKSAKDYHVSKINSFYCGFFLRSIEPMYGFKCGSEK